MKRIAEKFRNADNQDVTMEEGAMCGKPSSEEKGFDGGKLARDIAGEISGEYDIKRAWMVLIHLLVKNYQPGIESLRVGWQ